MVGGCFGTANFGAVVGTIVEALVGAEVESFVGTFVGNLVGAEVGVFVGVVDGALVVEGAFVGALVLEGAFVGASVGFIVGWHSRRYRRMNFRCCTRWSFRNFRCRIVRWCMLDTGDLLGAMTVGMVVGESVLGVCVGTFVDILVGLFEGASTGEVLGTPALAVVGAFVVGDLTGAVAIGKSMGKLKNGAFVGMLVNTTGRLSSVLGVVGIALLWSRCWCIRFIDNE